MERYLPFFNAFNSAFEALKVRCVEPSRVSLLVRNDDEARKTVGWLYFESNYYEQLRAQNRFTVGEPAWFATSYGEFRERWAKVVDQVYGDLCAQTFLSDDATEGISKDIWNPRPSFLSDQVLFYWRFVPGQSQGAGAIDRTMSFLYDQYNLEEEDPGDGTDVGWLVEGTEAWKFFSEEVRIDFDGTERRWRALPRVVVPSHLANRSSGSRYPGVVELLGDAVSAYLCGALGASVITCRAVMEHLLKTSYIGHRLDANDKDPGLKKLITWTEQEPDYWWVRKLRLQEYKQFADEVVHHPAKAQWGPDPELKAVEFLQTVRTLIERAPPVARPE